MPREWDLPSDLPEGPPTRHVTLPARPAAILSAATRRRVWRSSMDERCHYRPAVSGWWLLVVVTILLVLMFGLVVTCASIPQEATVR